MSNTTTKPVFVNTEMSKAIIDGLKSSDKATKAMARIADLAVAQWGDDAPFHFVSHTKKHSLATEDEWTGLRELVVSTFTADEKKVLALPKSSIDDDNRSYRKDTQSKIGSKITDIKNAVHRRVDVDKPKEKKAPRAPDVRIRDAAQDIIKVCESLEGDATFRPADIKSLAEQIIRSI
tara:strand:- start:184 stop:717 length:534 start_codon:yes stop_codon:yes gene_type:complete